MEPKDPDWTALGQNNKIKPFSPDEHQLITYGENEVKLPSK
jgi:hypothetical protein